MLQKVLLVLLLLGFFSSLAAAGWEDAAKNGDYKHARTLLQEDIAKAQGNARLNLFLENCLLLLRDQREEEAFREFQKTIEQLPRIPREQTNEEKKLFSEALQIYFLENEKPVEIVAEQLDTFLSKVITQNPDYTSCLLLQALARANKQKIDDFFKLYFRAYPTAADCYLVDKTAGILCIKLYEKAKTLEGKEKLAQDILRYINAALLKEPKDVSLYKLKLFFCPQNQKREEIVKVIDTITKMNVVIPKKDLPYYVTQALLYNEAASAKSFIESAKKWYTYSRTVEELEKVIQDESSN